VEDFASLSIAAKVGAIAVQHQAGAHEWRDLCTNCGKIIDLQGVI
jgi:hypothetical protein